jgi:hypothetical protein
MTDPKRIIGKIIGDRSSKNKNKPTYKITDMATHQTVFVPEDRFNEMDYMDNPNVKIRRLEDR